MGCMPAVSEGRLRMEHQQQATLTALLYSLKEDATWAWKQSLNGSVPDLFNLNRAWDLVVKEVQRLERERT